MDGLRGKRSKLWLVVSSVGELLISLPESKIVIKVECTQFGVAQPIWEIADAHCNSKRSEGFEFLKVGVYKSAIGSRRASVIPAGETQGSHVF